MRHRPGFRRAARQERWPVPTQPGPCRPPSIRAGGPVYFFVRSVCDHRNRHGVASRCMFALEREPTQYAS